MEGALIKKRFPPVVSLVAIIILFASTSVACGSTGYKTFSIKEGIQGFNFEYPSSYKLIRMDLSNTSDSQYTTVGLGANANGDVSEIYVYIWPTSVGLETASAAIDALLSNAASVLSDYYLDTKSPTRVNGNTAQGASFTATDTTSTTNASGPAFYQITCFIYNNLIVELDMTCAVSLTEATQVEYDHLLQTFTAIN